jgi:hypothetical protein
MRKLIIIVVLVISTIFMFLPTRKVNAIFREKHYTVIIDYCAIGPLPPPGTVVGGWTVDCYGNWSGWGWRPGDPCSHFEVTLGAQCYE